MSNDFLRITKEALKLHGVFAVYTRVSAGVYDIETGTNTNTSTNYSILMYKKHINASQYSYPDLIGKDSAMFYIASDSLTFKPSPKDKITYNSETFSVASYAEHIAKGQIVLYKLIGVRG